MQVRPDYLQSPIEFLKGVGPVKADLLKTELKIFTFADLLYTFPFRHIDRSVVTPIRQIRNDGQAVQVRGILSSLSFSGTKFQRRIKANIQDKTGMLNLIWFQGAQWLEQILKPGQEYLAFGTLTGYAYPYTMAHPEMDLVVELNRMPGFEPVYNSTEKLNKKGMDSRMRRKLITTLLENLPARAIPETLPEYLIRSMNLCSRAEAIRWIHIPSSRIEMEQATNRLKFEELFFQQLKLLTTKSFRKKHLKGPVFEKVGTYFNEFFRNHLRFELTDAQKRVIKEIRHDTASGSQMNRLLQGDVGAGKTIVGLMIMLLAIDNQYQACLMAPTEILATQHYASITHALKGLGLPVGLLTGSVKGEKRKELLRLVRQGDIKILIGTHALLEDPVRFHNLGLAIIDEQHRFGVAQRANLWQKNEQVSPHILVMTATPIPRTLSMVYYGDLDVSIIDQLPPGRKPIKTMHYNEKSRPQVYQFLKDQIARGRQIYIVYPLIEESEKLDLQDLQNGYEQLLQHFPKPAYQISVLHGRMRSEDKDFEMQQFSRGKTHILVATTVIEVGVDVPNASVMVIENAERFGLSQLHQLRGRVGRGADQAYCLLMTGYKLSKEARIRLKTMCDTTDGFRIAEVDLELRGPGELEGTRQSGGLDFVMVNLVTDLQILDQVQKMVTKIIDRDPELIHPSNKLLLEYLHQEELRSPGWSKIS